MGTQAKKSQRLYLQPWIPAFAGTNGVWGAALLSWRADPENFAGRDFGHAIVLLKQQTSGLIKTLKPARQFARRHPHAQNLAEAGRALEPIGTNGRKTLPAVPLRETVLHGRRQLGEQRIGHNKRAIGRKIRRRIGDIGRMRWRS